MTFHQGHTFSPGRRHGSRNKRTAEIFHRLENRGDLDPADLLSSIVTNNEEPKELRIQAAKGLEGVQMPAQGAKRPLGSAGAPPARQRTSGPLMGRRGRFKTGARPPQTQAREA